MINFPNHDITQILFSCKLFIFNRIDNFYHQNDKTYYNCNLNRFSLLDLKILKKTQHFPTKLFKRKISVDLSKLAGSERDRECPLLILFWISAIYRKMEIITHRTKTYSWWVAQWGLGILRLLIQRSTSSNLGNSPSV